MSAGPEPQGRGLLDTKRVVVTAAAGTGIGSAVAKRCLIEGAEVLISDIHERRLNETADRLADETNNRPLTAVCNVTVEEDVEGFGGRCDQRFRRDRCDDEQRRFGRHCCSC